MIPHIPSNTLAVTAHAVTHTSIHTQAGIQATVAVETTSTGLVAVESCPAWLARALAFHWVTAECVFVIAEATVFTGQAVGAMRTHPLSALGSSEARLTQTAPVYVIAACAVGTVTHTFTVSPVSAHRTLLTAPCSGKTISTLTLASLWITVTPVVTHTLLGTVGSKPAFCTTLSAHCTRPPRGTSTDALSLADAPILAWASGRASAPRASLLTKCPSEATTTQAFSSHFIAGPPSSTLALLQTALAECTRGARVFAASPYESSWALAGTSGRVTQSSILTLTQLGAVRTPVIIVTGTGAVVPSPTSLTLAAIWSNAPSMDTLSGTMRDTFFAAFVIARTTLIPPTIVHLHCLPVRCFIDNPVASASVGGPGVRAGLHCYLVIRV